MRNQRYGACGWDSSGYRFSKNSLCPFLFLKKLERNKRAKVGNPLWAWYFKQHLRPLHWCGHQCLANFEWLILFLEWNLEALKMLRNMGQSAKTSLEAGWNLKNFCARTVICLWRALYLLWRYIKVFAVIICEVLPCNQL